MAPDEDPELRRWFTALRREEAQAAPPFRRVWAAARAGRRPRRRVRFAVAAVALALLALLWLRPGPAPESGTSPSIAQWRSPTRFLLATPGRELLSTVPALGDPGILGLSLPVRSPETARPPDGGTS